MKAKSPRILWVTDPWVELDHPKDTTLRLIEESLRMGVLAYWCDVQSIRWEDNEVLADIARIEAVGKNRGPADFQFSEPSILNPGQFDRVVYRTDPPVDLHYLQPLQLLRLAAASNRRCEIINHADSLFSANEKLEPTQLGDLMPPSVVSSQRGPLEKFGRTEKTVVLKPLHQAQSIGVYRLHWETPEQIQKSLEILTQSTANFKNPVILQRYFPQISQGETRLWFINGKLLGAARKLPKSGEFKIDMDQGGTLGPVKLGKREISAARRIGIRLRRLRIRLAAVDLIEGYVTDFNITSPGLLVHFEGLLKKNLSAQVIKSLIQAWK